MYCLAFRVLARGGVREDSDVVVLVEVDPSIGLRFEELGDDLEKHWGDAWIWSPGVPASHRSRSGSSRS